MEADNALINQWEPKIQKMLQGTSIIGMDRDDIAQELRIAIMRAANGFDEDYIADELQNNVDEINKLSKTVLSQIEKDMEKIVAERKSISGLKFNMPQIMGVLNITPDSFSDGGLFFETNKAYNCLLYTSDAADE